jgi:hypothetical protein
LGLIDCLHATLQIEPKIVTLAFKCLFSGAGFGELTVPIFGFVKSPLCDLVLAFHVCDKTEKRHPRLQAFV